MIIFLIKGLILGTTAGISPGPLTVLLMSETLRHGPVAGIRIALIPLLTDAPIVATAFFFASQLAGMGIFLSLMSAIGACMVATIGYQQFKASALEMDDKPVAVPLHKAFWVNFLSPHPWLFWGTIGAPFLAKGLTFSFLHALTFLFAFYLTLIGSKCVMAVLGHRCRPFLQGNGYIWVQRILGATLIFMALALLYEAWTLWPEQ